MREKIFLHIYNSFLQKREIKIILLAQSWKISDITLTFRRKLGGKKVKIILIFRLLYRDMRIQSFYGV